MNKRNTTRTTTPATVGDDATTIQAPARDVLTEILRDGAQRLLGQAIQAEVTDWIDHHALRTLTKSDYPAALEMLGFPLDPQVAVRALRLPPQVRVGEDLICTFDLESFAAQRLLITVRIHFRKANGRQAAKVFTVKKAPFAAGQMATLRKKQSFKPMTTRVLYPGGHKAEVVVNGVVLATGEFELVV